MQRTDGGPPLAITGVTAERVGAAEEIEPMWFMATMHVTDDPEVLFFETGRRALPVCDDPALRRNIELFMRKLVADMSKADASTR